MAVYYSLTKPGDTILSLSIGNGAHLSMAGSLPKKMFKLNVVNIPYDHNNFNIDLQETILLIQKLKPKLLMLGGSVILFPPQLRKLAECAHSYGTIVVYDASHVGGLIAGKQFSSPYDEGADIVTMTTCKTIPGPQGAIIMSKKEYSEALKKAVFPTLHSSHHLHETVGTVLALLELKEFGRKYAEHTIANAQYLSECLFKKGFDIINANGIYTKSHMLLMDVSKLGTGDDIERKLESARIIVNRNMIPSRVSSSFTPSGLRIGTQEVTHLGMGLKEMEQISEIFSDLLFKNVSCIEIIDRVKNLRMDFPCVEYTF